MKAYSLLLTAIFLIALGGTAIAQDDNGDLPTAQVIPCPPGILTGFSEMEGETVECGTVTVPANYNEPDGATIDLVYANLKSHSLAPAPDPVIYLHGGPGVGELAGLNVDLADSIAVRFETLRQRRDVIVFDQRGVGYSYGEVDCKAIYDAEFDDAYAAAQEALGPDAPAYEPGFVAAQSVYGDCAEALTETGVDLTQYNTVNNARDVASLAQALGYDEYNLYGLSYGTRLGLEVLRQKPSGLRALIVDSVMPPEIPFNDRMPEANVESFQNIAAMCEADEACAEAYPDLVGLFNRAFAQLEQEPLEEGLRTDSEALANLLTTQINAAESVWIVPYLPRLLSELAEGNTDTWNGIFVTGELAPQTVADRFALPQGDAPFSAYRLLNTANDLARQANGLEEAAETVAEQVHEMAEESSSTPGDRFLDAVEERRTAPFAAVQELDFQSDLLALPAQEPVTATLSAFVEQHFSGADAEILESIVAEMTDEDVALLFENAHFDDRFHDLANGIAHYLYFCNEGIPFNSLAGLEAVTAASPIPGLTQFEAEKQALWLDGCERLPTNSVPEGFHEPVTGDGEIPVMVFAGTNDTQTATSWARQAADNLIGAQYVEFPNAGHGALAFSQCAKDIAAAFFDQPKREVVTACVADLIPRFVLPDEPLSASW